MSFAYVVPRAPERILPLHRLVIWLISSCNGSSVVAFPDVSDSNAANDVERNAKLVSIPKRPFLVACAAEVFFTVIE